MKYIPARPLENAILEEIKAIALKPDLIARSLEQHKGQSKDVVKALTVEKTSIENKIEHAIRSKEKQVKWLLDNLPEKAVADEVSKEIQKLFISTTLLITPGPRKSLVIKLLSGKPQ